MRTTFRTEASKKKKDGVLVENTNLLSLKGKVKFRDQILTIHHPTMSCMAE